MAIRTAPAVGRRDPGIDKTPYGMLASGERTDLFTLRNGNGIEVKITNYGGIVVSLTAPDRHGDLADVVLGFDSLDGFIGNRPYFGAVIGRYANRIAGGRFILGNHNYTLSTNDGGNHLHGGLRGFDKELWSTRTVRRKADVTLVLRYLSVDGEESYPGNLEVEVAYTLTRDNALKIEYRASTDQPTPVNLTNHTYFNLGSGPDILDHELKLYADRFTPVDAGLIPTGELRPVGGTPFDFRTQGRIGARIADDDEQLKRAGGYDHNFILAGQAGRLGVAAEVYERKSGRALRVLTTEPGLQFYSGNFLDGSIVGKNRKAYGRRSGFCLEAQHFPDSPNQPHFPSTILMPGAKYRQTTIYQFATL
ncbi:MAG: galactose mutarotase [Betaproteobacteria bacterium]|nr:galactose mutarotase [Betaproteobacteria bacterium]